MTVCEQWQNQRTALASSLAQQQEPSGVAYHVRHAIVQTEQNALAELSDDILRQQVGLLFSCIKSSTAFLDVKITAQVWVPQQKTHTKASLTSMQRASVLLLVLCCAYCLGKTLLLPLILCISSCVLLLLSLLKGRSAAVASTSEARITLQTDAEKLLQILDGQMHAVDRYLNDYIYLNDQLRNVSDASDPVAVSRAADLLEALYECAEQERAPACEAAGKLLESLGLYAIEYSDEKRQYFNALPSKNETRTLVPAILSVKDHRLLRRGTAAVGMKAA